MFPRAGWVGDAGVGGRDGVAILDARDGAGEQRVGIAIEAAGIGRRTDSGAGFTVSVPLFEVTV